MPGPGGGSHGGGFGGGHGGGSFGGGSHGGGFGGGPHGGGFGGGPHGPMGPGGFHRPPRRHFFFFGTRYYYGGPGSFFGGIFFLTVFLIFISLFVFLAVVGSCSGGSANNGVGNSAAYHYDEEAFQSYAIDRYGACYGTNRQESEDGVMLLFTLDDDRTGYYSIAIIGDHVQRNVSNLFGNEDTAYGQTVVSDFGNALYTYSISTKLVNVVDDMKTEVLAVKTGTGFTCTDDHSTLTPTFKNDTELTVNDAIVRDALTRFTDETGIPLSLVLVESADVFETANDSGKTTAAPKTVTIGNTELPVWGVVLIGVGCVAIVIVIVAVARKRRKEDDDLRSGKGNDSYRDTYK